MNEMMRNWEAEANAKKMLRERQQFEVNRESDPTWKWDPEIETDDLRMAVICLKDSDFDERFGDYHFLKFLSRSDLTDLCINDLSLCPIHLVDWAICFDDQPEDCDQVRYIYPDNHDT